MGRREGNDCMDYKNPENKDLLQNKIEELLSEYQGLFDALINNPDSYKKSALLYYWLRDYKNYLINEDTFSPNFYPSFQKGNIVNVNLGFNLGSEMGGLHYAIVLANSNRKNPNIVIAPLTSIKPGKNLSTLRPTEMAIGEELFSMIKGKHTALKTSIPTELKLLEAAAVDKSNIEAFRQRADELLKKLDLLEKTMKKLQVLKHGSIIVLNQIRTVSKMRISDPTDKYDILYDLKLSSKTLDSLDERLAKLYLNVLDK